MTFRKAGAAAPDGAFDRREILLGATATGALSLLAGTAAAQAPGGAPPSMADRAARLQARVARAEGLRAIRRVQCAYAHYLQFGMWAEAAGLFADDALMRDRAGAALGREEIAAHLRATQGGGRDDLAPGQLNAVLALSPVLNVSSDGRRARGRWREVAMRGQYGESARWTGGIYENEYVLQDGVWKIAFSNYYGRFEGPYEGGWRNTPNGGEIVPFHYDPRKAGTPVAMPGGLAPLDGDPADALAALTPRIARLNDEAEIRNLQNAYGFYVDRKLWDDVADLFAENATFERDNEGVYEGRGSIRAGFGRFGEDLQWGELNDHAQLQPVIAIAPDGMTATARGIELGMTGQDNETGQWSVSVFENSYVKDGAVWKIAAARIVPHMKADYAAGWAQSALPPAGPSDAFPPDRPAGQPVSAYPDASVPPFSFADPGAPQPAAPAAPPADAEAAMAEAERRLDVAIAYDGAENVSNAYGYYIDEFQWDDTADVFSEDGYKELSYVGAYVGRERVRASLKYRYGLGGRFGSGMTLHQKVQPVVTVAPDGQSARIRERLFQMNSSETGPGSYIGGIYENEMVIEDGVWKISGMDLDYVWLGNYAGGWTGIDAAENSRFAPSPDFLEALPPDGPLRGVTYAPFPEIGPMGFHYRNPVSGRAPDRLLPPNGAPL